MVIKAKISKGGKISLPSSCRKYLNVKDGDEIIFDTKDGTVIIYPVSFALEKARKIVSKYYNLDVSLLDKLTSESKNEAENE